MVDLRDHPEGRAPLSEASVSELVQRASQQTAELVRQEMQLAQAELKQKGRQAGIGAGMFGAAGLIAFYGLAALVAAAVLGLSEAVDPWLAAIIVGAVLLVVAGIVALVAKNRTQEALPAKPEQTMESVHDDVEHIKEQAAR
jgi:membrane protein